MTDVSVLIPARNEVFLAKTIENVMDNARADTEVIAVCDGYWPKPEIVDRPGVRLIHHTESIGQRAATNEAARLSQAKYVMKLDAHCAVDEGFDVKLMEDCKPDWTVIPRMYALDAFHWVCEGCGKEYDQGPERPACEACGCEKLHQKIVWKKKGRKRTDYMWFDNVLKIRYFDKPSLQHYGEVGELKAQCSHKKKNWAKGEITDVMCGIGACWFETRERYWELEGLDEGHGSWGQVAVEVACKAWLSGGRQVVNKKTWFAHLPRTQKGFSFPYPNPGKAQDKARDHSRHLWLGNNWPKQKRPLDWLVKRFSPLPSWETKRDPRTVVYYTDHHCDQRILETAEAKLRASSDGVPILSVSQKPMDLGRNIVVNAERSTRTMYEQILAGIEASDTDLVFLAEHDCLYPPEHFAFDPGRQDSFYFNRNQWFLIADTGKAIRYDSRCNATMCCYRPVFVRWLKRRLRKIDKYGGYQGRWGHTPGAPGDNSSIAWEWFETQTPIVNIRHADCLSKIRAKPEDFRSGKRAMTQASEIPGWGKTEGRFWEWLQEVGRD